VGRLTVRLVVDAPRALVWAELADIQSHVTWMADAVALRFTGERHRGAGTTFECVTKVGPLRTVDRMEVTSWREGREIGVRHTGLITGEGRFVLRPLRRDRTRITWTERLRFPWFLGGPVTAALARPVLRRIWRSNLRRFATRVSDRVS
jgi:hypothetical protein